MTPHLHYYLHDSASSFRFKLSGALAGEDVEELRQCWNTASSTLGSRPFLVDIDGVVGVDEGGRGLLRQWHSQGAQIQAASTQGRLLAQSIMGIAPAPARQVARGDGLWVRFAAVA